MLSTRLSIGIAGDGADNISDILNKALVHHGISVPDIFITDINASENSFDVFVVHKPHTNGAKWQVLAKAFVINSDEPGVMESLPDKAALVVTYGFNKKACITASSISDSSCEICVQRSFIDLNGAFHSQCEFSLSFDKGGAEAALAAASAALTAGFFIE